MQFKRITEIRLGVMAATVLLFASCGEPKNAKEAASFAADAARHSSPGASLPSPPDMGIGHTARYRHDDFPWIALHKGELLSDGSAARDNLPSGSYSEIEEVDPEIWLTESDAVRTLELTEQVLFQRDGFALVLLQIEMDDE